METSWLPDLREASAPLYLAIADALARDIDAGRLRPGTRLPTHRDLARRLSLNVGTVTRAYAEASRRGLLEGEVGRGTFVRHPEPPGSQARAMTRNGDGSVVDMAFNVPAGGATEEDRRAVLAALLERGDSADLMEHYEMAGLARHRDVAARWLGENGLPCETGRVLISGGGQHAMALVLASVCRAGEVVLVEQLTYAGIRTVAGQLHLRLAPVAMDDEGILPEALAAAVRQGPVRALYVMPTVHNPTGVCLSLERRQAVADICREHGVWIVEDDSYRFMHEDPPPPLAHLAPERSWYVTSFSKSLGPGLRVGLVVVPADADQPEAGAERLVTASSGLGWLAAPMMAEMATRWLADGTFERVAREKREEARARRALADRLLPGHGARAIETSCHLWLQLPEPWRTDDLVHHARERGVAVTPAGAFVVGRSPAPHAVRVCLSTPPRRADAERGLRALGRVLSAPRHDAPAVL